MKYSHLIFVRALKLNFSLYNVVLEFHVLHECFRLFILA